MTLHSDDDDLVTVRVPRRAALAMEANLEIQTSAAALWGSLAIYFGIGGVFCALPIAFVGLCITAPSRDWNEPVLWFLATGALVSAGVGIVTLKSGAALLRNYRVKKLL